jgi:hypothetical protein
MGSAELEQETFRPEGDGTDGDQRRAERYRALDATAVDLDDEEDVDPVLASLREARRAVTDQRRAR